MHASPGQQQLYVTLQFHPACFSETCDVPTSHNTSCVFHADPREQELEDQKPQYLVWLSHRSLGIQELEDQNA